MKKTSVMEKIFAAGLIAALSGSVISCQTGKKTKGTGAKADKGVMEKKDEASKEEPKPAMLTPGAGVIKDGSEASKIGEGSTFDLAFLAENMVIEQSTTEYKGKNGPVPVGTWFVMPKDGVSHGEGFKTKLKAAAQGLASKCKDTFDSRKSYAMFRADESWSVNKTKFEECVGHVMSGTDIKDMTMDALTVMSYIHNNKDKITADDFVLSKKEHKDQEGFKVKEEK